LETVFLRANRRLREEVSDYTDDYNVQKIMSIYLKNINYKTKQKSAAKFSFNERVDILLPAELVSSIILSIMSFFFFFFFFFVITVVVFCFCSYCCFCC
jgi:hypothetical protein